MLLKRAVTLVEVIAGTTQQKEGKLVQADSD